MLCFFNPSHTVSRVRQCCQMGGFCLLLDKVVELVSGGYVINGAYPVSFLQGVTFNWSPLNYLSTKTLYNLLHLNNCVGLQWHITPVVWLYLDIYKYTYSNTIGQIHKCFTPGPTQNCYWTTPEKSVKVFLTIKSTCMRAVQCSTD